LRFRFSGGNGSNDAPSKSGGGGSSAGNNLPGVTSIKCIRVQSRQWWRNGGMPDPLMMETGTTALLVVVVEHTEPLVLEMVDLEQMEK
jgi:hypothetical protein